jgi:SAM-dependent methyltransferase
MRKYLCINKKVYDSLASSYAAKLDDRATVTLAKRVAYPFLHLLRERFSSPRILEVGSGAGIFSRIFSNAGFNTTAIDISPKMINLALQVSPKTRYINGDFLKYDFDNLLYEGIFARAFVYLFPKIEAEKVFRKMKALLVPSGVIYIDTTLHHQSREGFLERDGSNLVRFKHEWNEPELLSSLKNSRLEVISLEAYTDLKKRRGINLLLTKSSS